jgi:homoserine O-acetyltransferase
MYETRDIKKKWHDGIRQLPDSSSLKKIQLFDRREPLFLESGKKLEQVQVVYQMIGEPLPDGSNVILVCHALTGSALVYNDKEEANSGSQFSGWWNGFVGKGACLDIDKYCIICSNILGSCYGTTGPTSTMPDGSDMYRMRFPVITVRDMVKVQKKLMDRLNISHVKAIIGGSLGAMQVWEWGIMYPDFAELLIPIAAGVTHSPWAIALNRLARKAIMSDPDWNGGNYSRQPEKGLALAREIAMTTYKSPEVLNNKFGRSIQNPYEERFEITEEDHYFSVENYLKYQGEKFLSRFDANTYLYLTKAMDLHDISWDRGTLEEVLSSIEARIIWIGISSDMLYPPKEFEPYVKYLKKGELKMMNSMHGHDAFLIEFQKLEQIISPELNCCRC